VVISRQGSRHGYSAVYLRYPRIKGIVYFNKAHVRVDWRLAMSGKPAYPNAALKAYRNVVGQSKFQGRRP
jgi:hypothetical protein